MKKRYLKDYLFTICIVLISLVFMATFLTGETEAASKFPSKTITYVIPTSPGGGFDTFSRMVLPFLQKYLPGNPKIIIKNAPGGRVEYRH